MSIRIATGAGIVTCLAPCTPAFAGFAGQPILGPIGPGVSVTGNTVGHADDNDGFTSGDHFFDIWDGGDDAWSINWPGGDLQVDLIYSNQVCEVDLFIYTPDNLDDSGDYGIAGTGFDTVLIPGAPAGKYYAVIDSEAGGEGAYKLFVHNIPSPGSLGLAGLGLVCAARRRRRSR